MPKKLERKLKKEAKEKFPGDKEKQDQYVYGTMNKLRMLHNKEGDHESRSNR